MMRILTTILVLLCVSCNNCKDDISEFNKEGYSFANGTPKDFEGYAVFRYGRNFDPEDGWEDDSSSILLVLNSIDDCITTAIDVLDLPLSEGDTIFYMLKIQIIFLGQDYMNHMEMQYIVATIYLKITKVGFW